MDNQLSFNSFHNHNLTDCKVRILHRKSLLIRMSRLFPPLEHNNILLADKIKDLKLHAYGTENAHKTYSFTWELIIGSVSLTLLMQTHKFHKNCLDWETVRCKKTSNYWISRSFYHLAELFVFKQHEIRRVISNTHKSIFISVHTQRMYIAFANNTKLRKN